eukprot:3021296-Prymnesium_polylepis.1
MWHRSPYTYRFQPSWAYIDDYLWYVMMWLDAAEWPTAAAAAPGGALYYLSEASETFELMDRYGSDEPCGGLTWMDPDVDPRKNAVTVLEGIVSSAQVALKLEARQRTEQAAPYRARSLRLWAWFESVGFIADERLVQDNVTGTAHGKMRCCNATVAPACEPRNTTRWSYNQGMLLGAVTDLHALTGDAAYLRLGGDVLAAVVSRMTTAGGAEAGGAGGVLTEPVDLEIASA